MDRYVAQTWDSIIETYAGHKKILGYFPITEMMCFIVLHCMAKLWQQTIKKFSLINLADDK